MSNPYQTADERRSVLGPTVRFKGELCADEDLVIEGRLEGSIRHTERVTIGRFANVKAQVHAQTVVVEGTIEGDVHATSSVSVSQSGTLRGDVHSPSFTVVAGARFSGNVVKTSPQAQSAPIDRDDTSFIGAGSTAGAAP